MLPPLQRLLFLLFAALTLSAGAYGFLRLARRIRRGRADTESRFDHLPTRLWYALSTTLTQSRTFRKRPVVSFFHSLIFYGFVFYLLVNLVDAIDGFVPLSFHSLGLVGNLYVLAADVLSALVLVGVVALVARRFLLPSRRDFRFNPRTALHPAVKRNAITFDSVFVSCFILFHVGSRAVGAAAKLAAEGPDPFAPFATLLAHLIPPAHALGWRIAGYWGALGSVLAFLVYFPYSKHVHIFLAPAKYLVRRPVGSGVLPPVVLDTEAETPALGANKLEDLAWPRLLDAYACIQCNRCQDVCPATATGKSLSPSALEINKRMELNQLAREQPAFERGAPSPQPLLSFALSPEAAWACTTCGACIDVCPVGDEPMLDLIDIRREQVMVAGDFPQQLQSAFRGMERAQNPWGLHPDKRLDWAHGLNVKTTDQNPEPDVLYWVGCAASYDPQSQKTARAFVQLLDHAGVDFAVLGKRECCTGDSARRAGNEYLYRQLADQNVLTLNQVKPKLIVATCPHCLNSVGNEYRQIGGDFKVVHHTEYLESLVAAGKLQPTSGSAKVAFHDPCYLGRHNGVYDAPRNLLHILSNDVVELPRNRENSFCCGAGGAQFWKEEEPGDERISSNRLREAQGTLGPAPDSVLAVGCPFCKSMLGSTPSEGAPAPAIKDVAELLLEALQTTQPPLPAQPPLPTQPLPASPAEPPAAPAIIPDKPLPTPNPISTEPTQAAPTPIEPIPTKPTQPPPSPAEPTQTRKKWTPRTTPATEASPATTPEAPPAPPSAPDLPPARKAWSPKKPTAPEPAAPPPATAPPDPVQPPARKAWKPKSSTAKPPPDHPKSE